MTVLHRIVRSMALAAPLALSGCFYDTGGGPADVEDTDTGTADGDAGADGGDVEGLGEPCTQTGGECGGYEADFCLYNPMDPTQGFCTTTGCNEDGCAPTYTCCDCTGAMYFGVDLCAPADYAEMLPQAGCACG